LRKLFLILGLLVMIAALVPVTGAQNEQVEIVFSHIFSDEQDVRGAVVVALVEQFMAEHPNVTVTLQSNTSDYRELFNNAMLAAEQGNAPHVVQVDESISQLARDSQMFIPISDLASEEQLADIQANFLPQILAFYTVDDKLWSIPWNTSNPLLYYNKDIFRAAGLDPEKPPRTFDEVMAACQTILAAQVEGVDACINFPLTSWFPEQWLAMQNVPVLNNDNGRSGRATESLMDSPELVSIVQWWKEMADKGYYIYSGVTVDYNGEAIIFLGKSTAMHINSTAGLTNFLFFAEAQKFELGVAPLIIPNENATNGVTVGGASLFISAGYSEAETRAAADFALFLGSKQANVDWHKGTGYIPNRLDSIAQLESEGWFEENPFFRIGLQQLLDSTPSPATAGMVLGPATEVRTFMEDAIQSVIDQGEDPAEALAAAKSRADATIQDYNALFE
jgi:sn-glycerol 3-phosphate transport system substrate-binding protein